MVPIVLSLRQSRFLPPARPIPTFPLVLVYSADNECGSPPPPEPARPPQSNMPFFKNVFKPKEGSRSASKAGKHADDESDVLAPPKPWWDDAWTRKDVAPEEIQELIHVCTREMKSRGTSAAMIVL